jgi:hypothetical protein
MEVHKPKLVHGWREFLTEIGVIVIGVCSSRYPPNSWRRRFIGSTGSMAR